MGAIKLTIAYDGTDFCGWQRQNNGRSVQAEIETAAEKLLTSPVKVWGAGRTDAGVHARGQVARLLAETPIPIEKFAAALNSRLPDDIAIRRAENVAPEFNPRYDAKAKLYRYTIFNAPQRPAIERRTVWHIKTPLEVARMQTAAQKLVGLFDFTSFANGERAGENNVREITACKITVEKLADETEASARKIFIDVEGRSFLYHMVRNIVGTLVDVGEEKIAPTAMTAILQAKDRAAAGQGAPARGLCLEWIAYA